MKEIIIHDHAHISHTHKHCLLLFNWQPHHPQKLQYWQCYNYQLCFRSGCGLTVSSGYAQGGTLKEGSLLGVDLVVGYCRILNVGRRRKWGVVLILGY